jgi:S-adenosylmethionine hydrolase
LKTFLQKLLQKKLTSVLYLNVTHKRDSFKLLLFANLKTNVLKHTVTQAEDVFTNQLFVMLSKEEHLTNVTQTLESVNVNNLAVTITTHVPLMLM